jgi:hypothetical protein
MVLAVSIMTFLLVFIVPRFEAIFHDMLGDKPLPAITISVISVSRFVQEHWAILIGVLVALFIACKIGARSRGGRVLLDRIKLRAPLFGDLIRKTAISRFSRTLGTLVTSGVPILQALNITRETAGNSVIARAISQVHDSVKDGESIMLPLETSGAFPPMVISMIDVGEETGQLPEMLLKIAEVYDDEVDNSVAGLTSLLEPVMIVFLALVVGTIVIALFMPLISIFIGAIEGPAPGDFEAEIDVVPDLLHENVRRFVRGAVIFDEGLPDFLRAGADQLDLALQEEAEAVDRIDIERIAYGDDQSALPVTDGNNLKAPRVTGADLFDDLRRNYLGREIDPLHVGLRRQAAGNVCGGNSPVLDQEIDDVAAAIQARLRIVNLRGRDEASILEDRENAVFFRLHGGSPNLGSRAELSKLVIEGR